MGVGPAAATSSLAALNRMVVLGVEVGVSGSAAFSVVAAPVSFGNPGTPSIADPPFTGVDTVPFAVEVEGGPSTGRPRRDLGGPVEAECLGREYGAGRSDVS